MTKREKIRFRNAFFREAGENLLSLKRMIDMLPDACFYIKDTQCRIVALNRRNCEICNIKDELDAVGSTSGDLFPNMQASAYMAYDREVMRTGKPLENVLCPYPADNSANFTYKSVFPIRGRKGQIIGTSCLYRMVSNPETVPSWHGRLKEVTRYIAGHYMEPLTLASLAALAHTSVSKFTRMFVKTLNVTPRKYVMDIRITAARRLLDTTQKTIVEITQETGFCDHSHFVKAFKKARGVTPGQYRRRHLSIGGN